MVLILCKIRNIIFKPMGNKKKRRMYDNVEIKVLKDTYSYRYLLVKNGLKNL